VIYNGHPGLITYYPELKGKDPQIRAWEGKYETVGSVVHKVTEGVDEGGVVRFSAVKNVATDLDTMYDLLKQTSLDSWIKFFKDQVLKLDSSN
jgi:folate-dependent phosphoribosylglycinamide formyltransferase PurN